MKGKIATVTVLSLIALAASAQSSNNGSMPLPLLDNTPKSTKPTPAPSAPISAQPPMSSADQAARMQRFGTIVDRQVVGAGGLTAWTIEKDGRRIVLYTTADGQAIISGIVWDAAGHNLSDQFLPAMSAVKPPLGASTAPLPAPAMDASAPAPSGALVGKFTGAVPASIQTVESLAGIKEGRGGPADTLYVIFDPRCPYCRKAYLQTREYVKRGATIKWIPAAALGNPQEGVPLAASVLQAKPAEQADLLRQVLGEKAPISVKPTKATEAALAQNFDFLISVFKNNNAGQPGVPVALFLDHRTGQPRMLQGVSEQPVIEAIFGKP